MTRAMLILAAMATAAGGLAACASGPPRHLVNARFDCEDKSRLNVVFDHDRDLVTVKLPKVRGQDKAVVIDVPSQKPEAGLLYAGEGYELRGAGDALTYTAPGRGPLRCVQTR